MAAQRNSYVMLAACTIIYFWSCIPLRLSGVIFVACIERYDVSRATAAYPIVIFTCLRCLMGPMVAYLSSKVGIKATITIGTAASALGVTGCFFAQEIIFVSVFLGVIYGCGRCMSISLIHHVLKPYFGTNYTFACGVTRIGVSMGGLVFSPIVIFLIKEYGVSGTFLIVGASMFNAIPVSLLIQEIVSEKVPSVVHEQKPINKIKQETNQNDSSVCLNKFIYLHTDESQKEDGIGLKEESQKNDESQKKDGAGLYSKTLTGENTEATAYSITKADISSQNIKLEVVNRSKPEQTIQTNENVQIGSRSNKRIFNNCIQYCNPTLIVILIISASSLYVYVIVVTVTLDVSREKGLPIENEVYILTLSPAIEIISNVILGYVPDRGLLSRTQFTVGFFLLMGSVCTFLVWATSFILYTFGIILFTVSFNALFMILPGLVCEFIEKDQQAMAQSSKFVLHGILCLTVSPLIGFFRDNVGSYNGVLYVQTCICFFGAALSALLPRISKKNVIR